MITPPPGVRVYLACGYTDMRKGMSTLAMLVQQTLGDSPSRAFGLPGRQTDVNGAHLRLARAVVRDRLKAIRAAT
jgi:hypothetical protein